MLAADTLFRALADETRLRCLVLLAGQEELCVCELTHALKVSQPKMSRHLAMLREAGLVADRRQGLWVFYQLNPGLPDWARAVLSDTVAGLARQPPFAADARRLTLMVNPAERCGPPAATRAAVAMPAAPTHALEHRNRR
ncbi:MAG TPA: metalloregulator ArsR/SmtB family transcription factor [bacterium]|nr:metalloregulator ArsR/SmtB family transcription factor [bacterium]